MRPSAARPVRRLRALALAAAFAFGAGAPALAADLPYPAAAHVPDSQPGWEQDDPGAPLDEAQGGRTALGTPISPRKDVCFPAETRNVFSEVDMVASGPDGKLQPLDFSDGTAITAQGRDAIRGQNTWMLWGEGNEAFWGWLSERGYGLVDFLVLVDSRKRDERFRTAGIVNQPGMKSQRDPAGRILGLYIDVADGASITLRQPPTDIDAATGKLAERPVPPAPPGHKTELFEPGDRQLYEDVLRQLPNDGLDPTVYGYASGVVGLRLMPNPDFFGKTDAAATARAYWDRIVTKDPAAKFYSDPKVAADPDLVRPFRMSMACAFCHVGPHPLNPPDDPEHPTWANLSSTIGNQYWSPTRNFANLAQPDNFLHHFLNSQQPGTIDTSLVSTDHINNANTINAIFDLPARLARAMLNPPEQQSPANLLSPGIEDGNRPGTLRHTPRVLLDGADSIGVFGALSRVYLNIGTFPEEWSRCHNPIIGFKPQRPFGIATVQKNSVYWRAAEKYRIPYLAAFFTTPERKSNASVTQPMKLADAPGGKAIESAEADRATRGRDVFFRNCAICHSSRQPDGFALKFSADWKNAPAPAAGAATELTLPTAFADWDSFKQGKAYAEYQTRLTATISQAGGPEAFLRDNFLSTDIRVPVTLVGTNSGRSVGTNGMRGQVWDNFSSEDYKHLPAVGEVHFYNPYSGKAPDPWGNNDAYQPPGGGPGYYRPASLISLWATAPYLHNNTLGLFDSDPSVAGRLRAFDDGIDKLLWNSKRVANADAHPGDLRATHKDLSAGDTGFIYRTPQLTYITFAPKFIRPLISSVLGDTWTSVLTWWLWLGAGVLFVVLALTAGSRFAGFVSLLIAIALAILIVVFRLDKVYGWIWLLPIVPTLFTVWLWLSRQRRGVARVFFVLLALASVTVGWYARSFVGGERGALAVGPIPAGTPVNLLMNINPEAAKEDLIRAVAAMTRAFLKIEKADAKDAAALKIFQDEAGLPLLRASKCPDFVLDRGHWFGEALSDDEKHDLKAFLKTL